MGLVCVLLSGVLCGTTPAQTPVVSRPYVEEEALLDTVPNYATLLQGQWSAADVPVRVQGYANESAHYGRLQQDGAAMPLTLADCVALALAHNTQLQISRLGPLGAQVAVRQAQSIFDPALFAEVNGTRTVTPATSGLQGANTSTDNSFIANIGARKLLRSGGLLEMEWTNSRINTNFAFASFRPQYNTGLSLTLAQPLLRDFGLHFTTLRVRIAQTTEQQSVKAYEVSLTNLLKGVEVAYWALVGTQENVTTHEKGLALAQELLRQNTSRFEVGTVPRTAVLEAQADVARREADLIRARNLNRIAHDTLRATINAPVQGATALLSITPTEDPTIPAVALDLDRSLQLALAHRPDLAAKQLDVTAAGMQLKMTENQLLPKLDLVGSVGLNGLSGNAVPLPNFNATPSETEGTEEDTPAPNPFAGPYSDALDTALEGKYYSYVAGVTVEVPLHNAAARAAYTQSGIALERQRRSMQQLLETITFEVTEAVTNLESDMKSVEARQLARQLAEENVRNQKARYDVGLATTKDLLDFQERLTQARAAEIAALTLYRTNLAELRRAEGTLLQTHNVVLDAEPTTSTPWWARF